MLKSPIDLTFDCPAAGVLASDAAFWQLYDSSFPSTEREPSDVILSTVQTGAGFVVRARVAGITIGLACAHMLRRPPALFLVYLAVAPEWRSHGVGSSLFEQTWTTGAARYVEAGLTPWGCIFEVDTPEAASNQMEQRRRIAFFERLGSCLLPQRYLQPPVDRIAPVAMHLMFRPAPGISLPDSGAVSQMIRAIYFEKYHAANGIPREALDDLLRQIQQ